MKAQDLTQDQAPPERLRADVDNLLQAALHLHMRFRDAGRANQKGSNTLRAPRRVVSNQADTASSSQSAMSLIPSPCFAIWSAMALPERSGVVNTKRIWPCSPT